MQFQKAEFVASYGTFSQIPPCNSMEIAFAGRSNVGKSTLINKIFQRKSLARVLFRGKQRQSTFTVWIL